MQKKILFIIGVLDSGGVAKSIVNLLNAIDRTNREVHLLIMSEHHGPYEKYIPEDVILHRNAIISWLLSGFGGAKELFVHGHLLLAFASMMRMLLSKIDKPTAAWLLARLFPAIEDDWDTIIDFNGQQDLYYMIDKLHSKKKITFFHNDYTKWAYYERIDRKYFKFVDSICSVSEQCVESLKTVFPEYSNKIHLVENVSLPDFIQIMASQPLPIDLPEDIPVLVTVGHVCDRKGSDFALKSASILKNKGVQFVWLFVGEVIEPKFKDLVVQMKLENNIRFVGMQSNPYPFMKAATIIVHPSRYEGKSIALDEAKILCKPIVVTNFSTVNDQFEDGVNAIICKMDGHALADAIEGLLRSEAQRTAFSLYLKERIPYYKQAVAQLESQI